MFSREHTDREYEHELRQLREQLLVMGSHVEAIIGDAITVVARKMVLSRATCRASGASR